MKLSPAFRILMLVQLIAQSCPSEACAQDSRVSDVLTRRAHAFTARLDEGQRKNVMYAFDDDERFDLRLAPINLEGLRIDQMTDAQWKDLEVTLSSVLSPTGLTKMNTIRSLEREVAELEGGLFGLVTSWMRDPKRYFLALFGEPRSQSPWGMRFDGHHLSLNWTAVPGESLSVTPLFLGGQPRAVPDGLERAGLRVLADEEDRAVLLINGLSEVGRAKARMPFREGGAFSRPMFVGEGGRVASPQPVGQPVRSMAPASRTRLNEVIGTVLGNFVPQVADRYRAQFAEQIDATYFAYAIPDRYLGAPLRAGTPLYYRIQGAGFLIEYDNTSEEADHIHLVWREFDGDFGRDLLAEHLKSHH